MFNGGSYLYVFFGLCDTEMDMNFSSSQAAGSIVKQPVLLYFLYNERFCICCCTFKNLTVILLGGAHREDHHPTELYSE